MGKKPSARLSHLRTTDRKTRVSACLKAHFFLLSERLGTQGRGAGTSAWALETPLPLPEPMETDWQVGLAHPNKSPVSFLLLLMWFFSLILYIFKKWPEQYHGLYHMKHTLAVNQKGGALVRNNQGFCFQH